MFGIDAMTPADFRRPSRSRFLGGLGLTLAVAAAWLAATTTAPAQEQGVKDYVLSNVSAIFNGTPVSISGFFTVEGNGSLEWRAFIDVTSSVLGSPYTGTYSWNSNASILGPAPNPIGTDLVAFRDGQPSGQTLGINFANLLTNPAVTSVVIGGVSGTDPTGVAVVTGQAPVYSFSSDASFVLNGNPVSITGSFTYDSTTDIEYAALMYLTGPSIPPNEGQCFFDVEELGGGDSMEAQCGGLGFLQIGFANELSSDPDPLADVFIQNRFFEATAPTGFVCTGEAPENPCPAMPEPSSLAILGAALGLFLVISPAIRRASSPSS